MILINGNCNACGNRADGTIRLCPACAHRFDTPHKYTLTTIVGDYTIKVSKSLIDGVVITIRDSSTGEKRAVSQAKLQKAVDAAMTKAVHEVYTSKS